MKKNIKRTFQKKIKRFDMTTSVVIDLTNEQQSREVLSCLADDGYVWYMTHKPMTYERLYRLSMPCKRYHKLVLKLDYRDCKGKMSWCDFDKLTPGEKYITAKVYLLKHNFEQLDLV